MPLHFVFLNEHAVMKVPNEAEVLKGNSVAERGQSITGTDQGKKTGDGAEPEGRFQPVHVKNNFHFCIASEELTVV